MSLARMRTRLPRLWAARRLDTWVDHLRQGTCHHQVPQMLPVPHSTECCTRSKAAKLLGGLPCDQLALSFRVLMNFW